MVESPTRPWRSLSGFEATPSIQVSIQVLWRLDELQYFEQNMVGTVILPVISEQHNILWVAA